jgi:prepilin-type N-terminal cleavage/methylation domain-containing protein
MMATKTIHTADETRQARSRSGFSMLEIMIALGVLSLGVLGMTAGQLAAIKLSGDSRSQTTAMSLAQQQVETIQTMTATDVKDLVDAVGYPNDPDNPIDANPDTNDELRFNRSWVVAEDTPEAGVITVTVTVRWTDERGTSRAVRLRTLKADI